MIVTEEPQINEDRILVKCKTANAEDAIKNFEEKILKENKTLERLYKNPRYNHVILILCSYFIYEKQLAKIVLNYL